MPATVTNLELEQRVRDMGHEQTDAGPYDSGQVMRQLEYAMEEIYEHDTARRIGWGSVTENFTIAVGDPDGRVPGSTLPLPVKFLRLVNIMRNNQPMVPGDVSRFSLANQPQSTYFGGGRYWLDGPNQITDVGGNFGQANASLFVAPDFVAGDVIQWLYIEPPPKLIDPLDPDPNNPSTVVTLDLLHYHLVHVVVALATAFVTARGDEAARRTAVATANEKMEKYKDFGGRGMSGQLLSDYNMHRRGDNGFLS